VNSVREHLLQEHGVKADQVRQHMAFVKPNMAGQLKYYAIHYGSASPGQIIEAPSPTKGTVLNSDEVSVSKNEVVSTNALIYFMFRRRCRYCSRSAK
jgi:hypothetical protein